MALSDLQWVSRHGFCCPLCTSPEIKILSDLGLKVLEQCYKCDRQWFAIYELVDGRHILRGYEEHLSTGNSHA